MEKPPDLPPELLANVPEVKLQRAAVVGRYLILKEMGFFSPPTNVELAQGDYEGSFIGAVRRKFSNNFGDVAGCHPADIEIAAEMLGVFDDVFDVEFERSTKWLQDAA